MSDNIPTLQPMADSSPESKRALIDKCIALKSMPHIYDKLKKLWGFPAFFDYIDNLLLMEPGREDRHGLPEEVYREIDALEHLFIKFPDEIAHPTLIAQDREEIRKLIADRKIKINYLVGDR
ncbi:MAG TPA: hypothetical protein PLF22_09595 [Pseudomonadales bacterium]|nr:hypothetical protein [Pseudomonadales bacterium]